jgi:threonine synthase
MTFQHALQHRITPVGSFMCKSCGSSHPTNRMIQCCPNCAGALRYQVGGTFERPRSAINTLWRYFDRLPLEDPKHVCSLGEGFSEIIRLEDVRDTIHGADLYLKLDFTRNPTGTFKDREASLIISRCRAAGLDNLVYYSTANTGRSYTHYAAHLGMTTYLFMPVECQYKHTANILRMRTITSSSSRVNTSESGHTRNTLRRSTD